MHPAPVSWLRVAALFGSVALLGLSSGFKGEVAKPGALAAASPGKNGRIAYRFERPVQGQDPGPFFIRSVRPDGTGALRIKVEHQVSFAFSPDGRRIAYETSHGIDTVDIHGRNRRHVTTTPVDGEPDWSPSGRRLIFSRAVDTGRSDLWISYFRGERRLIDGSHADWSSRGDIAFTRALSSKDGIYVIRPDGSQLRRVRRTGSSPNWSPNGRRIAFRMGLGGPAHIATMRADGSDVRQLTRGPWKDHEPAYSPDGKQIVFVRDEYLPGEASCPCSSVLTMTSSGTHLRRVAKHFHINEDRTVFNPDWQPRAIPAG
jgi:Tol biopolymer transport system component